MPVSAIDWKPVTRRNFNYLLRQKPGPQNALGSIKFMMPNPYSVYLHDTPSRELFARQERSFSSGCIRLEEPMVLAEWLLGREGHPRTGSVAALMERQETLTRSGLLRPGRADSTIGPDRTQPQREMSMPKTVSDLVNFAASKAATEYYPTPAERLVKGRPEQHNTLHFEADGRFFAGEWELLEPTRKIYVVYENPGD